MIFAVVAIVIAIIVIAVILGKKHILPSQRGNVVKTMLPKYWVTLLLASNM